MIAFPVSVFALKFAVSATLITVLAVCVIEFAAVTKRSPSFPATPVRPSASEVVSAPAVTVTLPSSIELASNKTMSCPDAVTAPTKSLLASSRTMSPPAVSVVVAVMLTSSATDADTPSSTIEPTTVTLRSSPANPAKVMLFSSPRLISSVALAVTVAKSKPVPELLFRTMSPSAAAVSPVAVKAAVPETVVPLVPSDSAILLPVADRLATVKAPNVIAPSVPAAVASSVIWARPSMESVASIVPPPLLATSVSTPLSKFAMSALSSETMSVVPPPTSIASPFELIVSVPVPEFRLTVPPKPIPVFPLVMSEGVEIVRLAAVTAPKLICSSTALPIVAVVPVELPAMTTAPPKVLLASSTSMFPVVAVSVVAPVTSTSSPTAAETLSSEIDVALTENEPPASMSPSTISSVSTTTIVEDAVVAEMSTSLKSCVASSRITSADAEINAVPFTLISPVPASVIPPELAVTVKPLNALTSPRSKASASTKVMSNPWAFNGPANRLA